MSYLLFMDESGHDHKIMPYEVRGGVALHARRLWPFVQAMRLLEANMFGDLLHRYGAEVKGHRLLDRKRFEWAGQMPELDDATRRKLCLSFLNKGTNRRPPNRVEFTAYGQACLGMARGIFRLLCDHEASLFAAAIPKSVVAPRDAVLKDYLRKDHVFLLERYFYFLELKQEPGLLVLDETEKALDRRFVRQMHMYFTKTRMGLQRTAWVVPSPFFVSSDMNYAVQAADVCIYCLNWGYRMANMGMNAPTRPEIEEEFAGWIRQLQFRGEGYRDGQTYRTFGVVYVPDPYTARA